MNWAFCPNVNCRNYIYIDSNKYVGELPGKMCTTVYIYLPRTDYMRKTQICVRAALAIQHVLHDIASGSVLRINSRKRVIVTNRFFAKVK